MIVNIKRKKTTANQCIATAVRFSRVNGMPPWMKHMEIINAEVLQRLLHCSYCPIRTMCCIKVDSTLRTKLENLICGERFCPWCHNFEPYLKYSHFLRRKHALPYRILKIAAISIDAPNPSDFTRWSHWSYTHVSGMRLYRACFRPKLKYGGHFEGSPRYLQMYRMVRGEGKAFLCIFSATSWVINALSPVFLWPPNGDFLSKKL